MQNEIHSAPCVLLRSGFHTIDLQSTLNYMGTTTLRSVAVTTQDVDIPGISTTLFIKIMKISCRKFA